MNDSQSSTGARRWAFHRWAFHRWAFRRWAFRVLAGVALVAAALLGFVAPAAIGATSVGGTCPRAGGYSTTTPRLVCRSTIVRGRRVLRWVVARATTPTSAGSSNASLAACIRGPWVEGADSLNTFIRELTGIQIPVLLTGELNYDFDGTQMRGSGSIEGTNTADSGLPPGFITVTAQAISIVPYSVGAGTITVRSQFSDRAPAFFDLQIQMNGAPVAVSSRGITEPSITSAATCSGNTLRFVVTTPAGRSASRTLRRLP
jgi:hypothetical protein